MNTVLWHTLLESIHRKIGLVLLGIAALVPLAVLSLFRFETLADGSLQAVLIHERLGPAAEFVPAALGTLLQLTSGLLLFLVMFAAAPMLTTYMERGWVDLLVSKGVERWKMLLGRYGGGLGLFLVAILLMNGGVALYFWARTGYAPGRFVVSLGLLTLSFAALLALMAVMAMLQASTAILIVVGFMQLILSSLLANREQLYRVISAGWAQWIIEWLYRLLPKNSELHSEAASYLQNGSMESWWAAGTTLAFVGAALGLAYWLFHRKSF